MCKRSDVLVQVGICALGVASEASELLCLSYVLPLLEQEENFEDLGSISAAAFAGMMIGGLAVGFASDVHGRKPWLVVCSMIAAASGIAGDIVLY